MKVKVCIAVIISIFCISCNQEKSVSENFDEINVRLKSDPQRINPFFAPTSLGREVFQYIFLPLADFHPDDLKLHPILIDEIPEGRLSEDGNTMDFDLSIKEDARWSDGTSISAADYDFTLKTILHPLCKARAWRSYFNFFKGVNLSTSNQNQLTVSVDKNYMLSKELSVTINLFPKHIYDPDGLLDDISLDDYKSTNTYAEDSTHIALFEKINDAMNQTVGVVQNGPYELTEYESEQYILLNKKADYWGSNYPDNPFLQSNPEKIIFKIIPDEVTAVTMAKDGNLDFLSLKTSNDFLDLKEDSIVSSQWSFHSPQLMMYYYIAINNKSDILSDVRVRKALAHITDVDDYIDNIDGGLGQRTIGHFHPSKSYYNEKLPLIKYDLEKAKSLFAEAGWRDSDNDGDLDKDGKDLELDILMTGSPLSRSLAILFQESANNIGFKVNIVQKKTAAMRKENLATFNYDLAMLAVGQDAAPDDPYSKWHTDNAVPGGTNTVGYSNASSDSLIQLIRTTTDEDQRKKYYLEWQEVVYQDQPIIFLYCPLKKFMISKNISALTTSKRPGYLANTFELAD